MKKLFIIIVITVLSINIFAQGDSKSKKGPTIKSNVLGLFTLFFEQETTSKTAFQIGLQFNPNQLPKKNKTIYSITPEFRIYKGNNSGVFYGPYIKYIYQEIDELDLIKENALAAGLTAGYKYQFSNRIMIECFVGGGYKVWQHRTTSDDLILMEDGDVFDVRISVGLGYKF